MNRLAVPEESLEPRDAQDRAESTLGVAHQTGAFPIHGHDDDDRRKHTTDDARRQRRTCSTAQRGKADPRERKKQACEHSGGSASSGVLGGREGHLAGSDEVEPDEVIVERGHEPVKSITDPCSSLSELTFARVAEQGMQQHLFVLAHRSGLPVVATHGPRVVIRALEVHHAIGSQVHQRRCEQQRHVDCHRVSQTEH